MGAYATGAPLLPKGYVAGPITGGASPQNLLSLIQAQLDPNVNASARYVRLQSNTTGGVYIGTQTNLVGALSSTNYGVFLPTATATFTPSREYGSNFPGSDAPLGDLWVLTTASNSFNVEVW